jgi:hypothetical protein
MVHHPLQMISNECEAKLRDVTAELEASKSGLSKLDGYYNEFIVQASCHAASLCAGTMAFSVCCALEISDFN